MAPGSPIANAADRLVFWSEESPASSAVDDGEVGAKRESMYVNLFEDMLKEVLVSEAHLFSHDELGCIKQYDGLSYNARYLLIRLCLRKTDKWHRLSALNYREELGDGILPAIQELCRDPRGQVKVEEREFIDLTFDEQGQKPVAGPSRLPEPPAVNGPPDYSIFAQDEAHASLRELLDCLSTDELKAIAKQMKVKPATKRDPLINAVLSSSSTQATLDFPIISSSKSKGKAKQNGKPMKQTQLTFTYRTGRPNTQADRLREMVMNMLVKCVRINEDVVILFRRINLVYFRSTQHTPTLLTPSILSRAHKRSYAPYQHRRTPNVWPSREALLAYEDALALEAQVDALLEGSAVSAALRERSVASKVPTVQVKQERGGFAIANIKQEGNVDADMLDGYAPSESPRVQNARAVKAIFEEVFPRWQAMVNVKGEEDGRERGLERFDCGHILTRVVCKGSYALGVLKEHQRELDVLEELLAQRRWRRGRRGRWYDRRALILMTHCPRDEGTHERAMQAVTEALLDEDTHIVFRPMLERRLTKLENRLKIPPEDRHVCEGKLEKAAEVYVEGVRVLHRGTSMVIDRAGRPKVPNESGVFTQAALSRWSQLVGPSVQKPQVEVSEKATGKSVWIGRENEEVTVEMLALQHYEALGYKGFHCEGRIVTTLFGLLFWDIIFASVPGAFETPFQSAPLDIAEDTFYFSRKELADLRLDELREGKAPEILERVFAAHGEKGTWCVGVRWDLFTREDLLAIATYLGGEGLAIICRLFCEDYAGRGAGVPDLIIYNPELKVCKFAEVKGPGDILQENQKVWIDVLLQAGIVVEVCRVVEQGTQVEAKAKKGKKNKRKGPGRPKRKREEIDSDAERPLVESEDEPDYSRMDVGVNDGLPITPKKRPVRKVVNRAEVVITSSPHSFASPVPTKKRRLQALPSSP
ncbi:hypothetical protein SCP_0400570 [Sparassis crispa]|uniref:Fanconi-associated nuclease n=1 Tax=Sparassis crispa TaxID=139825 RepID=A0A401GHM4_9APHY|nr:hypothetical protein SCP_0400570 [Sparassis crispa]GBE81686.1 hypothetical protein SCP_0400570 [Sparassis crispa]